MEVMIICGGAQPPYKQKISALKELDDASVLIGVDRGALYLVDQGFQLDHAVGDFDSVDEQELLRIRENASYFYQTSPIKDDTDMELALSVALSIESSQEVEYFIFGGTASDGRLDHLVANLWMIHQPRYQSLVNRLTFFDRDRLIRILGPGQHLLENQNDCVYLSIISATPVKALEIVGAKYELSATDFAYPRALISNEFVSHNHEVQLSFKEGIVFVILEKNK
ncbi:thiamine diphosphokinase [Facklamia sp. DSM 111018]|uniref:Thiamine diphosphokinase n=1 Tax=Facklamia lactis TaxID=2749967 RepID=A0ABS0LQE0_9LACT|nr:thiamine diphosphokinase [Facklamia lactis]MBG9979801.1 thiamine diphosphokinase [Facklamia lactis]MBG9985519.1 thiamine diphosphokinase [Facklamia lactis]